MKIRPVVIAVALLATLSGCEELGIPDPAKEAARAQAEGEAIGSACRHAGRALEDCYTLNPKASKADIFSGWRNMNDYMIENKIDIVPPTLADTTSHAPATEPAASDPADDAPPSRPRPPGRP
ncbi:hypothetical protein [Denitromonas sp.]|uniref:hypothetical protein n=1 Tax=Denitromonas sp. TaxID=2734609 RepID=UPI002AFF14B4|nr:hypothetical protein [Denitromonas sp.]